MSTAQIDPNQVKNDRLNHFVDDGTNEFWKMTYRHNGKAQQADFRKKCTKAEAIELGQKYCKVSRGMQFLNVEPLFLDLETTIQSRIDENEIPIRDREPGKVY